MFGEIRIVMKLDIASESAGGEALPPGSAARVEVRDTSLADAPAKLLKRVIVHVPKRRTTKLNVLIEISAVPDGTTVWAHVDVDGDDRVSQGDYVSVESYPVTRAATQKLTIRVRKVT